MIPILDVLCHENRSSALRKICTCCCNAWLLPPFIIYPILICFMYPVIHATNLIPCILQYPKTLNLCCANNKLPHEIHENEIKVKKQEENDMELRQAEITARKEKEGFIEERVNTYFK